MYKPGQRWSGERRDSQIFQTQHSSSFSRTAMASSIMSAFCLAVSALLLCFYSSPTVAQADLALDCCLTVSPRVIPKHVILAYQKQSRGDGCPRDAVIFITRKGLNLCAPPASEESWVRDTMTFLDKRREKCKETRFIERRCHALKFMKF